ncbi:MAG: ferritin [Armatimonadetes bacterium]|nr:ferritin [Armatimonadota bacterium]
MLSEKMQDRLNEQIKWEFYSCYLYLSMAAQFEAWGYRILAQWMKKHAEEEHMHAMKMFDYVNQAGGRVKLAAIDQPPAEWDSPEALVRSALDHEREVTRRIHSLVAACEEEKDYATRSFLQWYVDEQVEEEAVFGELVLLTERAGPERLFLVEQRLLGQMQ